MNFPAGIGAIPYVTVVFGMVALYAAAGALAAFLVRSSIRARSSRIDASSAGSILLVSFACAIAWRRALSATATSASTRTAARKRIRLRTP
jgi:hypothetical protein